MKQYILGVFLLSSILLLSGCGPIYKTTYSYYPPRSESGRMCAMQCQQTQMMCNQMCEARRDSCRSQAWSSAQYQYEEYKHERRREHKSIDSDVNDFYDTSQCDNISCGCSSMYNNCYVTCGGRVVPHTVCVAFCNQ